MGHLSVTKLSSNTNKADYIFQLLRDIEALDLMIEQNLIEKTPIRIGAEQEFCIVDSAFKPANKAIELLKAIDDEHFTTEIGNFNLEINLDPLELKENCFSNLHKQLRLLLDKSKLEADKLNVKIILTGILPTLTSRHIDINNMTPKQRYFVLNEAIKESRKEDFEIHIKGVDELNLRHDSVMLEGCNTSFQMHLQINPDNFVDSYNWAQAISGPILSACTNSPFLFGKELWSETRIALFTQSVDTRANSFMLNEKQSRVSFGSDWTQGSVTDIFKDNVSRFRSLLTSGTITDSVDQLNRGEIPKLKALQLHNGTVYRWNRACYGVGDGKPHLRIENRYIAAGPTATDQIANMMFWVGVMLGRSKQYEKIHKVMAFKDAKHNFFSAARYGMAAQFYWNNQLVSSQDLILNEFIPMAYKGLYSAGISSKDAEYYLEIIRKRVTSNTGSQWMVKSFRNLLKSKKTYDAMQTITSKLYEKQSKDYPVSSWRVLDSNTPQDFNEQRQVIHNMSTDIFSVDEYDSLELVLSIMRWKNINHMPVINDDKKLVGLLSRRDVDLLINDLKKLKQSVKNTMVTNVFTASQFDTLEQAKTKMITHKISCLPVVENDKLIGIITTNDY
ncbi:MAG: CBS domain-containing protein [Flavobacteriaceae bacterium]|nr:CBS domain-containing protein [Flavobacteriaceae bacterium]